MYSDNAPLSTPDELVSALDALDVPFLRADAHTHTIAALSPARLLAELAQAPEARLRAALIPLLLRHPEFAAHAQEASAGLPGDPHWTLELFYTAARLLRQKYSAALDELLGTQPDLPDLFGVELGLIPSSDVDAALQQLAERHASLLHLSAAWAGTYEHAVGKFMRFLKLRGQWTQASKIHAA